MMYSVFFIYATYLTISIFPQPYLGGGCFQQFLFVPPFRLCSPLLIRTASCVIITDVASVYLTGPLLRQWPYSSSSWPAFTER